VKIVQAEPAFSILADSHVCNAKQFVGFVQDRTHSVSRFNIPFCGRATGWVEAVVIKPNATRKRGRSPFLNLPYQPAISQRPADRTARP
jgi:hypothetical protein